MTAAGEVSRRVRVDEGAKKKKKVPSICLNA